ncbi:MAG: hypothetical protein NZ602_01290 [Thermoguttaceae bacterium]|nr:hypothetical protein [Thermoguttaceae bacterium]MDW8038644.1 hypothetical protein [Thermoguttaceae bacterium]
MGRYVMLAVGVLCVGLVPAQAWAVVIFSETFDGPNLPTTLNYTSHPNITWSIVSGRLFCDYIGGSTSTINALVLTNTGFIAPGNLKTIYSLDVGVPTGITPGNFPVGMIFGDYQAVFHPGYSGGAFRMEGGWTTGNQNMGWTPKLGVLHHMEVVADFVAPNRLAVTVKRSLA